MLDGEYWLSPPPHYLYSITFYKQGLDSVEEGCFFPIIAIVGWVDYVPTASVLYKCNPTLPFPFPCVLHECSHNRSTYAVSVSLTFFFPLFCLLLQLLSLPLSLSLIRPRPVLRFCQAYAGRFRQTGEWSVCHAGLLLLLRLFSSEAVT